MKQPSAGQAGVGAVRQDLHAADDEKIKRVVAMLDDVTDPKMNQTLLDPLRDRLALLNLPRPLRFTRLLFLPLDPLIVAPGDWKPGAVLVPRSALAPIANLVRSGLGDVAVTIDKAIAKQKTDATRTIGYAGKALWPRAGEILATAAAPSDWDESDLPIKLFEPLARMISAVLRRGPQLRSLLRAAEIGVVQSAERYVADILRGIESESADGCALIVRLILLKAPHAAPLLRQFVALGKDPAGTALLQQAIDRSTEEILCDMESKGRLANQVGRGALANVGLVVRRITTFLREIEECGVAADRPRLYAIRQKLDAACRERFSDGLNTGLLTPLAVAAGPMDGTGQRLMESCGRDLRELETEARKVGGGANYDRMLTQASEAVVKAAAAGTLTPVRKLRLIEIVAGPEAAEELYRKEYPTGLPRT